MKKLKSIFRHLPTAIGYLLTATLFLSCDYFFDIFPPSVKILEPKGAVFGKVKIVIEAEDNRFVKKVELYIDGKFIKEFSGSGKKETFEYYYDFSQGFHTLMVKAYDRGGNWRKAENSFEVISDSVNLISPSHGEVLTNSTVEFRWSSLEGAIAYHLQVDDNDNFSSPVFNDSSISSTNKGVSLSAGTYYWRVKAKNSAGGWGSWSYVNTFRINSSPSAPAVPSGSDSGIVTLPCTFWTSATDPDGDQVAIRFDWGDGNISDWSNFVNSGQTVLMSHSYSSPGTYYVKAQAKDVWGGESEWSSEIQIVVFGALDSGLVLYLSCDEGSGNIAYDRSGYNNNGTIYGATWTQGISGSALYFDGVDDYVEIPNDTSLNPLFSLTYCVWIQTSNDVYSEQRIISKHHNLYGNGYWVDIDTGYVRARVYTTGFSPATLFYPAAPATWYFITVRYNGARIDLFIDATLVDSVNAEGTIDTNAYNLLIGASNHFSGPVNFFHGIIDEVRIYNRALSENEIQRLYNGYTGFKRH